MAEKCCGTKDAVAKERAAFIARKRKAIQDKREKEERARIAKIEAAQKQQAFEAASKSGEARAALKDALAAYQQLLEQTHDLESALIEAGAHQALIRGDANINGDKLAKALGSAADQVAAAGVRLERLQVLVGPSIETLTQAIIAGRNEFMFLFLEARKERLAQAVDQLGPLFDKEVFRRLKTSLEDLARTTHEVVNLDRAVNYQAHQFTWASLSQEVLPDGRVLQKSSAEQLLRAATEIENRFLQLDSQITAPS